MKKNSEPGKKKSSEDRVFMGKIARKNMKGLILNRDFRHIDILMLP